MFTVMGITVRDTVKSVEGIHPDKGELNSDWCSCEPGEFLCYPENGVCTCGIWKHHVHCKFCGGVTQIG